MPYPKVLFKSIPISLEIEWMYGFLFYDKWGWEKKILKVHPELKAIYKQRTKKDREKFLRSYILRYRKKNNSKILRQIRSYEKSWHKVEKKYLSALTELMLTSWPKRRKRIFALVSVNPICPRFLNGWSFSLFYKQKTEDMLETIMHEICHFLYFKKWKEVFSNAKDKTFEYPYLEWHLSEILAPVILQDPRIQKFLSRKSGFYDVHKKVKINKMSVPAFFTKLYNKNLKKRISFTDFLKEAYKIAKENKKLFKL